MKEPKVSVVICTYNSGEITRRAIESVLNNNYDNIECIVVDGASNDGTLDLLEEYKKELLRVMIVILSSDILQNQILEYIMR